MVFDIPDVFIAEAYRKFSMGQRELDPYAALALFIFLEKAKKSPENYRGAINVLRDGQKISDGITRVRRESESSEKHENRQDIKDIKAYSRQMAADLQEVLNHNTKLIDQNTLVINKLNNAERARDEAQRDRDATKLMLTQHKQKLEEMSGDLKTANERANAANKRADFWTKVSIVLGIVSVVLGVASIVAGFGLVPLIIGAAGSLTAGMGAAASHFGLIPIQKTALAPALSQAQAQKNYTNTATQKATLDVEVKPVLTNDESLKAASLNEKLPEQSKQERRSENSCKRSKRLEIRHLYACMQCRR
jgi:ABC-type multidrug transport system fused ATPase/permease subunit